MGYLSYLLFVCILVIFDQYSKKLVITYISEYSSIELIPNFFKLTNVKNTGAAWSLFEGQINVFVIVCAAAVLYLSYELIKKNDLTTLNKIADVLIIGGAIGNLIDRVNLKYVIDFLDFYIFGYDFPVFNLADCFLTVGCFLYIVVTIMEIKNAKH